MNNSDDDNATEPADLSASPWWQEMFGLDSPPVVPGDGTEAAFPEITVDESSEPDPSAGGSVEAAPDDLTADKDSERNGSRRRHTTYTLETADTILGALRALPPKDPSQRRLDKQAVIRHLVDEITALQKGGYPLEEIAAALTAKGLGITCATLKNYLQRIRRARAEAARKGRSRAELPLVLRGRIRG